MDMHADATVELKRPGSQDSVRLPILEPTLGRPMVDLRQQPKDQALYSYDPGLTQTGICKSAITYVDGEKGVLLYRGYPIDALVEGSDYLEVSWLLLNGELP